MKNNYIKPIWPAPPHIKAYTTTRLGGFSHAPYDQFNLGDHVGDATETVAKSREKLIRDLHLPAEPHWLKQIHSATVISLDASTAGTPEADAAYTRTPQHICAIMTADCLPLLVTNRNGTEVAAIHAGWRGLLAGIIDNTIKALNTAPEKLLVWLGPAIGPNVFEVGNEVHEAYVKRDARYHTAFVPHRDRRPANIYQLATLTLQHLGVVNIDGGNFCTYQQKELFYSYRRDQGQTGRMATLIYIDH